MSQGSQPRKGKGKGKFVPFVDSISNQAGPSSLASAPVAQSASIQAAPIPATQVPPIPTIRVTGVLDQYRPASRDHRGAGTLMQAAWAAAPMPKSFLEAIAQANDIRENTYKKSNANRSWLTGPVTMPPATVPLPGPPTQQSAFSAYRPSTDATYGGVTQSFGPSGPSEGSSGNFSSRRPTPRFPPGLYPPGAVYGPATPWQHGSGTSPYGLPSVLEESDMTAFNSMAPIPSDYSGHVAPTSGSNMRSNRSYDIASPHPLPPVHSGFEGGSYSSPFSSGGVTPRARPILPSENPLSNVSFDRSSPHLGSNIFAPGLRATPGSLYDNQFVPPALPTPTVVSSGNTTVPHLGTNLSSPIDAETASSLRLAHVLRTVARPYPQTPTYYEPRYHGYEFDLRNQPIGSERHSSSRPAHQLNHQAPPFDPRASYGHAIGPTPHPTYQAAPFNQQATYEIPPHPRAHYIGGGHDTGHQPGAHQEQTTNGPQPPQYLQPNTSNTGCSQHGGSRLLSSTPEPPAGPSGSAAASRGTPRLSPERETWTTEPESREAAIANLEQAQRAANLAGLRVGIRQTQLENIDKKVLIEKESEDMEQESDDSEEEDDGYWQEEEEHQ